MASTKSATERRESSGRGLKPRSMPFAGLFLLPIGALAAGLAVHAAVADNVAWLALTCAGITALTCGISLVAWGLGRSRDSLIRWLVVVTAATTGLGEAITVAVGLQRAWTTAFVITGEAFSLVWALTRIDSLRKDAKGDEQAQEDTLTKKLGLENTRFGKPKQFTDAAGEVTRIEVPVQHGPGETADVIQHAVPGLESVADQALGGNVPRGRSRAVPTDGAGASTLVIITKDVLKGMIHYPGPSSPGGCITEPIHGGVYEDQQLVVRYIAGGHEHAPNPSGSGWMGMTRTGKTMDAQTDAEEIISRRNVQMMWFDTIKGAQTVRPLRRGLDIIVASDDPKEFRKGMKALMELIKWRANELGKYGYRSWTPAAAADPRLKMPFLVPHFEEADALTEIAPEEMVFLASKGLSTGVSCGFSLQRADNTSMPTGLRFNIGNWKCFGTGDDYSAGFALSSQTIDAGAHPENWKQSKVGYHYIEGIGIDEQRWPVPAKAYFDTDQGMEAHCEMWGPRMQPLDAGSIAALGDWYVKAKAATAQLVADWDAGPDAKPVVHDGVSEASPVPVSPAPAGPVASGYDEDDDDDGVAEIRAAVQQEIDEIGDELDRDGTYDDMDSEAHRIDPGAPLGPIRPDAEVRWGPSKAEAPTREAAIEALGVALHEVLTGPPSTTEEDEDDESVRREPDGSVVFSVGALSKRYRFRSQPWFSEALRDAAAGAIALPGLALEPLDRPGEYRLQGVEVTARSGNSA